MSTNPFIVDENRRVKIVDGKGRAVVKHGLTGDEGFLQSLLITYTNLLNHFHFIIAYLFVLSVFFFEIADAEIGPLEMIRNTSQDIIDDPNAYAFEKPIAVFFRGFMNLVIPYKMRLVSCLFAFFTWSFKPTKSNLIVGFIICLMVFFFRKWHAIDFIIVSQFHHMFASLRNPVHKLIVIIIGVFILFISVEMGKSPMDQHGVLNKTKEVAKKTISSEEDSSETAAPVSTGTGNRKKRSIPSLVSSDRVPTLGK